MITCVQNFVGTRLFKKVKLSEVFPECNSEGCNYDQGRCLNSPSNTVVVIKNMIVCL